MKKVVYVLTVVMYLVVAGAFYQDWREPRNPGSAADMDDILNSGAQAAVWPVALLVKSGMWIGNKIGR
jgi:hypothetical protein